LETQDLRASKELLKVNGEKEEILALPEIRVLSVYLGRLVPLEKQDQLVVVEPLEHRARKDQLERLETQDPRELQEFKEVLGQLETREALDRWVLMDHLDRREPPDHLVSMVKTVNLEFRVLADLREEQVIQVRQDHWDQPDSEAL
jgi:hypothetical protein